MKLRKFMAAFLLMSSTGLMAADTNTDSDKANDPMEAFTKGSYDAKLRLSYEYADADNGVDHADSLTLGTYLGFRTAELGGVSLYIQGQSAERIVSDYDDTMGLNTGDNDVVADADGHRVQQAYLDFTKLLPDTTIRFGRQEMTLDDVRFIGDIVWRQRKQSFDGISLVNKSMQDTALTLAVYNKVNTIFNTSVDFDHIGLINAKYTGIKDHAVTGFLYLVDADEDQTDRKGGDNEDSVTYGFRLDGKFDQFAYDFSVAQQSDYANTEGRDAQFVHAFGSYKVGEWTPGAGYMYLSNAGNDGKGFDTLFSTAHKYNGWSDQFLGSNGGNLVDGLQDYYVSLAGKIKENKVILTAHYFDTVNRSEEYGYEFNGQIVRKLTDRLTTSLTAAYYDGNEDGTKSQDETVVWFRLDYAIGGKIADIGK